MPGGLFGKLPAKRDFVSVRTPRRFLDVYEPWLQAGVATSRQQMGEAWQDAYLRMPIWRFFLGAHVCGATAVGALMPSVDAVGRYFPLTVQSLAAEGSSYLPPDLDDQATWFSAAEQILLDALDTTTAFEATTAAVEALAEPADTLLAARPPDLMRLSSGAVILRGEAAAPAVAIAAARTEDHAGQSRNLVVFWTEGGEGFPPATLVGTSLPEPTAFVGLLTGSFAIL